MFQLSAQKASLQVNQTEITTSGAVNVFFCEFTFGVAGSNGVFGWIVPSLSTGFSMFFEYGDYYSLKISVSGNTVSWYSTGLSNPGAQINYSGTKYSIVRIG